MTGPAAPELAALSEGAQRAAGVVAARHRGDFSGANELLASFADDAARAAGCLLLADPSIALLAKAEGRAIDEVAGELCMQLARLAQRCA